MVERDHSGSRIPLKLSSILSVILTSKMDLDAFTKKLLESGSLNQDHSLEAIDRIVSEINHGKLKIIDLVKALDPILTNGSHEIRLKGVQILSQVIVLLLKDLLIEQEILTITEFLCLRIIDHHTMEKPALRCLAYFVECKNKPLTYDKHLLEYFKSNVNIRKMDNETRKAVYGIVKVIVTNSSKLDCDMIYTIIHIIEGESHPGNLLVCYGIISFLLKTFPDIEPYIDDVFLWLSSYYPIDYTPDETSDGINIQRSDLVEALYNCFYATELNSENLQTLLLEKLETNLISTKLESLNCLIKCYETFPVETIKNYASSLWTFIRMSCLKNVNLVDPLLLETCYRALSSLAKNLSKDEEYHFDFVCNMYDELSIAFRKPELDLFEPAARLLAHTMQPKLKSFNYVLNKILPTSLNILNSNDLSCVSGLAYIFKQLAEHHPNSKLSLKPNSLIDNLIPTLLEHINTSRDCLMLLRSMIEFKLSFNEKTLTFIFEKLISASNNPDQELEECLALACLCYNRFDVIVQGMKFTGLETETTAEYLSNILDMNLKTIECSIKYSTYLRITILVLDSRSNDELNNLDCSKYKEYLLRLRTQAREYRESERIIGNIADIHAILLNKLDQEYIQEILMGFFASDYCQKLVPSKREDEQISAQIYLPVVKAVLKSLVFRNHQFTLPIINLLLNLITSNEVSQSLALQGSQSFGFIQDDIGPLKYSKKNHYRISAIRKQKFYMQSSKEIKIRHELQKDGFIKYMLITALAVQIPYISKTIYKKDYEWLMRELMQLLTNLKKSTNNDQERLVLIVYESMEKLVEQVGDNNSSGLLGSLTNLHLDYAVEATTMKIRRKALLCLAGLTTLYNNGDLLLLRPSVIDKLRPCLSDKKRLVRQAAAHARLKWVLIGQPIGSSI